MSGDSSNGYDAIADKYIAARSASGRILAKKWAVTLRPGCSVIDIGAGSGEPITSALIEANVDVSAIDASPRLVAAFRQRFPTIQIACEAAETSTFFGKTFDAAIAIGLIFLLTEDAQATLIRRIADALNPGGRLLFSAPVETGGWRDILTDLPSISLGKDGYLGLIKTAGLELRATHHDEGGTHYYEAEKPTDAPIGR